MTPEQVDRYYHTMRDHQGFDEHEAQKALSETVRVDDLTAWHTWLRLQHAVLPQGKA